MTKITDWASILGANVDDASDYIPIIDQSETGSAKNKKILVGELIALLGTGYTDEQARDAIGAALVAGSGISITVNDGADTIIIAATGGGGGSSGSGEATWATPTLAGNFPTTRAGTGSVTDFAHGVRLAAPATSTNTNSLVYALQSISAGASGWRATARLRRHFPLLQWAMTGIMVRNSGDSKSRTYALGNDATTNGFNRNTFTNDTTWASVTGMLQSWYENNLWMRIHDDLTNHKISVSLDGDAWMQIYSEARTTHVTPDQVGFFMLPNMGASPGPSTVLHGQTLNFDCLSWEFESLP